MLRNPRQAPRTGFTLIELLVVIGIMALLAALLAAGVGQVRNAQMSKTTDQTVVKIQQGLDRQWRTIVEQAQKDRRDLKIPRGVILYCDGDLDRAEALWAYMKLRTEMPENATEATTQVQIPFAGASIGPLPLKTFVSAGGTDVNASLLYLILAEKGNKGVSFDVDDVSQAINGQFTVFTDAWNTPIRFKRFAQTAELNEAKHGGGRDPLDPTGKLLAANWPTVDSSDTQNPKRTKSAVCEAALGVTFGANKRVTAISAGSDKTFAADPLNGDDHYGYRLVQFGNRGD